MRTDAYETRKTNDDTINKKLKLKSIYSFKFNNLINF